MKPDKEEHEPTWEELGLTPDSCNVSEVHPGEWLEGPEDYAMYLDDALATGDPAVVTHCLMQIAQVMGTSLPENLMQGIEPLLNMLRDMRVQLHAGEKQATEAA